MNCSHCWQSSGLQKCCARCESKHGAVGSDLQPGALDAVSGSVVDEQLISALRYVWETQHRVWPPLALIRVRGTIQPSGSGLNISSRFHFQLKCCITVSHLLLCTTNTSTGYCYSLFFYFKYLYTYLTNVLKKCYFAFKSSSGFVACVRRVCARMLLPVSARKHSSAAASVMLNSGRQSALTKLILYIWP